MHFGIESTPDRTKFKVFVVVARDRRHAQQLFEAGPVAGLPRDVLYSPGLVVYRDNPSTAPATTARLSRIFSLS